MSKKPLARVEIIVRPGLGSNDNRYTLAYYLEKGLAAPLLRRFRTTLPESNDRVSSLRLGESSSDPLMIVLDSNQVEDVARAQKTAVNVARALGVEIESLTTRRLDLSDDEAIDEAFAALKEGPDRFGEFVDKAGVKIDNFVDGFGAKLEELVQHLQKKRDD